MEFFRTFPNITIHHYREGELDIEGREKNFAVIIDDDNRFEKTYDANSTYLIDCIIKTNEHRNEVYCSFLTTEDFFRDGDQDFDLPILIFGSCASALWIADICLDKKDRSSSAKKCFRAFQRKI